MLKIIFGKHKFTPIGCHLKNFDNIIRRLINELFFQMVLKSESEEMQSHKALEEAREQRKLSC